MGTIVYYLPKAASVNRDKIKKAGLAHILPEGQSTPEFTNTQNGPDGGVGVIFAFSGADKVNLQKTVEHIKWKQIPKTECYFGFDEENPPGPKDLQRKKLKDSYPVKLSDGNEWKVAIIRKVDGGTELEKNLEHNGEEWVAAGLQRQYVDMFERAGKVWDQFITPLMDQEEDESGDDIEITVEDGWDLAVDALALNYRISFPEITLLNLFDTSTASQAALASIDWLRWCDYVKKNGILDGQDSSAGEPEE